MLTALAAELGLPLVVDVTSVFTQNYHRRQVFQALEALGVFPLFNGDPPSTIPDAVNIPYLGSLACNSAKSPQPHTDIFTIYNLIKDFNNDSF